MVCKLLLDSEVLWAGARGGERVKTLVNCIVGLRGKGCSVYWSPANRYDLELEGSREALQVIEWALRTLGQPTGPRVSELKARLGRYHRWKERIGEADVMIVLTARDGGAILVTGDPGQARFYEDLTGRKPLFIPLKQL